MIERHAQLQVIDGLDTIRQALAAQLRAAQAAGEVGARLDIDSGAEMLLVLYEGMLALARTGPSMTLDFTRTVDTALQLLSDLTPKERHD